MIQRLRRFIHAIVRRNRFESVMSDEIRFHIDEYTADLIRSGISPEEARRRAHIEFGAIEAVKEECRDVRHLEMFDNIVRDLRYLVRASLKTPAFTVVLLLTLAIGVAAATSVYGIRALLLGAPPHVESPDHVFTLHLFIPSRSGREQPPPGARTSYPFYERVEHSAQSVSGAAAFYEDDIPAGTGSDAVMTHATMVSAGFWRTLGTVPWIGRFIEDAEAHPATGSRVVVLGYGFWQRRFGGSNAALGQSLQIKGRQYQIIGVAPRGFRGVGRADMDLWLPLFAVADGSGRGPTWYTFGSSYDLRMVIRLKPDVSADQGAAELTSLQQLFLLDTYQPLMKNSADLEPYRHARILLGSMKGGIGDDLRQIPEVSVAQWLLGIGSVLAAIAFLNVAGLLLLRAMRRHQEFVLMVALGASRSQLIRQFFVESAALALAGGTTGLLVISWAGAWLQRVVLPAMAWDSNIIRNPFIIGVGILTIFASCMIIGIVPTIYLKGDFLSRFHGRRSLPNRPRMQSLILVAQAALCVMLLLGAGLFLRSLQRLRTMDIGLERESLAIQINFAGSGRNSADVAAFFERALQRVSEVPGVERASLALTVPLRLARGGGAVRVQGRDEPLSQPSTGGVPFANYVTAGFFEATGMKLVRGRGLLDTDRSTSDAAAPSVIVVNEAMAHLAWPDKSAIGECVYIGRESTCTVVVGVVADARRFNLINERAHPYYYAPLSLAGTGSRALLLRVGSTDRSTTGSLIRRALQEMDSNIPYISIETLGQVLETQVRPWRLGATVFAVFGSVAIALAGIGLWASVSYAATQRKQEFAIRVAIGAERRSLLCMVLYDGLRTIVPAVAIGIALGFASGPFIAPLLYGVSPHDFVVYAVVAVGVLVISICASLLPAIQASRVSPAFTLRME